MQHQPAIPGLTNKTQIFQSQRLLQDLIFPYIGIRDLVRGAGLVNSISYTATKSESLWKKASEEESLNNDPIPYKKSWRLHFLLNQNFRLGKCVSASPVEYNSFNPLDPQRLQAFQVLNVNKDWVSIWDIKTDQRVKLKATGFNAPAYSHSLVSMALSHENYVAIKAKNENIQVYDKKTGEHYWTIDLPDAEVITHENYSRTLKIYAQTLICNDLYLASIEGNGKILRVWDLKEKTLLWEDRFNGKPNQTRDTLNLHFKGDTSPIISWLWEKERPTAGADDGGLWLINVKDKTISNGFPIANRYITGQIALSPKMIARFERVSYVPHSQLHQHHLNNQYLPTFYELQNVANKDNSTYQNYERLSRAKNQLRDDKRNIFIRDIFVAIGETFWGHEVDEDGCSRIILLNTKTKKTILDKKIDHFMATRLFLTEDSLFISGSAYDTTKKTTQLTLLKYTYDPEIVRVTIKPEKSYLDSLFKKSEPKSSAVPPVAVAAVVAEPTQVVHVNKSTSLLQRVIALAKRFFAFLFSPIKWAVNLSISALQKSVKVLDKLNT